MKYNTECICIFGSVARDSHDSQSDRDILIVSDSRLSSNASIIKWESEGWSVAYYTWERLLKMAAKGSLFLQHLKQDGHIISDPIGDLQRFLSQYIPKNDYNLELKKSIPLIRPIDRPANTLWQAQFHCDVLYTFIRNAGILELASHQIYEFDFYEIINLIGEFKGLSSSDIDVICKLRIAKTAYRQRSLVDFDCHYIANLTKDITSEYFGIKFNECEAFSDARFFRLPYATLRDIEARFLAYASPIYIDTLSDKSKKQSIWDYVINPRTYSWSIRSIDTNSLNKINMSITNFAMQSGPQYNLPNMSLIDACSPIYPNADTRQ